jgi:hypothetical protein
MKTIMIKLLLITIGLFGATMVMADFDGSEPLVCSFGQIIECDYGAECMSVTNESVDAPDFVEFDFKKKQFVATAAGEKTEPDDIDNVQDLENNLIVQGVQGTTRANPLGWSISINQTTGRAVLTAAGDNAGFVVFGACMPK